MRKWKAALTAEGSVLTVFIRLFLKYGLNLQQSTNAAMFELQVYQDGKWKRLKTFDGRHDAMSAAFELERGRQCSGTKVMELSHDPEAMAAKKKILHRWSAEDDSRAVKQEREENFERQRQHRSQIRAKRKIENERRKKQVRNIIVLSSLTLIFVAGFAGVLILGSG